jgi:epoxyqueuosine reductase
MNQNELKQLAEDIKQWGKDVGFQQVGISDTQLAESENYLQSWLKQDFHGEMDYMQKHGYKRTRPEQLIPGTLRIISVRMNYLPELGQTLQTLLNDDSNAIVSQYAQGRDYHKVLRSRLKKLSEKIAQTVDSGDLRLFVDSAPVMEKAIAEKAGLGWIGKHTNLIHRQAGSWFFLGEIYTNLAFPIDVPATNHCGQCRACLDICPTQAIIAPYRLDARLCISYLTIELHGSIPESLRPLMGNRIYGCDDCQLICPWNRFAKITTETDFLPRHRLNQSKLVELFKWDKKDFDAKTEGSAIRRLGYERWLRNIAVALGNARQHQNIIKALEEKSTFPSDLVQEHVDWALKQQIKKNVTLGAD